MATTTSPSFVIKISETTVVRTRLVTKLSKEPLVMLTHTLYSALQLSTCILSKLCLSSILDTQGLAKHM